MNSPKIINDSKINWNKERNARLNYQMLFSDGDLSESMNEINEFEPTSGVDIELKLNEARSDRDKKWKIKVQKTYDEAFKDGYSQGKLEGLQQAQKELEEKFTFITGTVEEGHNIWKKRQELIDPGLLDLAFDIAEAILGVPVENPELRKSLELSLGPLLEQIDNQSKPVLLVAESDYEFIQMLKDEYAPDTFLKLRVDHECKPGEFRFESSDEILIHKSKTMLQEFRKTLQIPSWQ